MQQGICQACVSAMVENGARVSHNARRMVYDQVQTLRSNVIEI